MLLLNINTFQDIKRLQLWDAEKSVLDTKKAWLPNQFSGDGGTTIKAPMNNLFTKQILLRSNYQKESVFQQIVWIA